MTDKTVAPDAPPLTDAEKRRARRRAKRRMEPVPPEAARSGPPPKTSADGRQEPALSAGVDKKATPKAETAPKAAAAGQTAKAEATPADPPAPPGGAAKPAPPKPPTPPPGQNAGQNAGRNAGPNAGPAAAAKPAPKGPAAGPGARKPGGAGQGPDAKGPGAKGPGAKGPGAKGPGGGPVGPAKNVGVAKPGAPGQPPAQQPRPAGGPMRLGPVGRMAPPQTIQARPRRRHGLLILSFVLLVLAPAIFVNWYLHARAVDQYASSLAFTIQSDKNVSGSVFETLLGGGTAADDAEVLYGFIQSQNLVERLEDRLGLRARFNKPEGDWWFRLGEDPSIEHLVDYWERMVLVAFDAGIVEVEVRAFAPEDAQEIARAVLEESTSQINRMSAEAREDAVRDARGSLDDAVTRLKAVRRQIAEMRARDQSVNPNLDVQALMTRIAALEADRTREQLRLEQLQEFATESDSRVIRARRSIDSLSALIAAERDALAGGGEGGSLSSTVGEFEELNVDRELAQEAYAAALESFEVAKREAQRKQRYLSAHIEPTFSQSPQYPERYILGGLAVAFLFMAWVVLVMISYNIRDRR